jgi:phosphate uptake regulator
MELERRRVQAIGGSLFISLPQEWVRRVALRKGAEVGMGIDARGNLAIGVLQALQEEPHSATLDYHDLIYRDLISEYLKGTDTVAVRNEAGFTKPERDLLGRAVANLLNSEIVEESHKRIVVQNFAAVDVPVRQLIRRMYFLAQTMLRDLAEERVTQDLVHGIEERDRNLGRLYFAVIRHLRSILKGTVRDPELSPLDALDLRLFIERLEQIGDAIKAVAREMAQGRRYRREDLRFLLERYGQAYEAYEGEDARKARAFWASDKDDRARIGPQLHLQRMYDAIKDIADLVI